MAVSHQPTLTPMSVDTGADRIPKVAESSNSSRPSSCVVPNPPPQDTLLSRAREMWAQVGKHEWVSKQHVEPLDQDGKSVLLDWLECVDDHGKSWKCGVPLDHPDTWCEHAPITRVHRAVAHVRMHLGLRPYPCGGLCGTSDWCVMGGNSTARPLFC
jgi:hypothetical protein